MSSPLAIAAVTQVIKGILTDGLVDANLSGIGTTVTAFSPDKIEVGSNENDQLNIFMYMSTHNQGWRNRDFPSRNTQGQRISNPFLPLDLHYILSAYGKAALNPEILLGYGMQVLHENPVLARELIRLQLTPSPIGPLPASLIGLSTAGLAEQIEQIKITPDMLSTEEVSRLWTSFGAKHRQSAYYKVSVVLIKSEKPARVALPVKKPLIYVRPFKQPIITKISSRVDSNTAIIDNQKILSTYQLVIRGMQLKGKVNSVVISGIEQNVFEKIADDQLIITIPTNLKAGLQSVQVVHKINMGEPATSRRGFNSNAETFILSPRLDSISEVNVQVDGNTQKAIRMQITPLPDTTQQVSLFLNQLNSPNPEQYRFEKDFSQTITPASPVGALTIPINGVVSGTYLVRVRVDNAESWIADDYQTPDVDIT